MATPRTGTLLLGVRGCRVSFGASQLQKDKAKGQQKLQEERRAEFVGL